MSSFSILEQLSNPFVDSSQTFNFYPSLGHRKVVQRIVRGLESMCGLVLLTGEIGIGKTTLCRHIKNHFKQSYVFAEQGNPFLTPAEQLYLFCREFDASIPAGAGPRELMDALVTRLFELNKMGRKTVIIIDESHLLTKAHFGQVLVLSNLRYQADPLVQIVLVGQLEILDRLREDGVEAVNQRIGVRCELSPLSLEDTGSYIRFKLEAAQFQDVDLVTPKAVTAIWKVSGGLPRLINHICAHAFDQLPYAKENRITRAMVLDVANDAMYSELFSVRTRKRQTGIRRSTLALFTAISIVFVGGVAIYYLDRMLVDRALRPLGNPVYHNETTELFVSPEPDSSRSAVNMPSSDSWSYRGRVRNQPKSGHLPDGFGEEAQISNAPQGINGGGDFSHLQADSGKLFGNGTVVREVDEASVVFENIKGLEPEDIPADRVRGGALAEMERDSADASQGAVSSVQDGLRGHSVLSLSADGQSVSGNVSGPVAGVAGSQGAASEVVAPLADADSEEKKDLEKVGADVGHVMSVGQSGGPLPKAQDLNVQTQSLAGEPTERRQVEDGAEHPVIGRITIDAVAWSDRAPDRIAVLNEKVMRVGDSLGAVVLIEIGEHGLIFEYKGALYERAWR